MTNELRITAVLEIIDNMHSGGVTQMDLAIVMGIKQPYISMIFSRAKTRGHMPIRDAKIEAMAKTVNGIIANKPINKETK